MMTPEMYFEYLKTSLNVVRNMVTPHLDKKTKKVWEANCDASVANIDYMEKIVLELMDKEDVPNFPWNTWAEHLDQFTNIQKIKTKKKDAA